MSTAVTFGKMWQAGGAGMRSRVSGRVVQTTTCAKQKQHNNQFRDFMAMFVIPQNITKWLRVALVVHGVRDFRSRV